MIKVCINLIFLFFCCCIPLSAQISVKIDSVDLYNVNLKMNNGVDKHYRTDLSEGPSAVFHIAICNESDEPVLLDYDSIFWGYMFCFNNCIYHRTLFQFVHSFEETLLLPNEKITLSFYPSKLITKDAYKENNYNYSRFVASILPSMKCFIIRDNQLISSDSIGVVKYFYGYENEYFKEKPPKRLKNRHFKL